MKCVACGKEHSKKDVLFTEDRQPYCVNPHACNDKHPNSVKNILARQGAVEMYTEAELEDAIFNKLDVPQEVKNRIQKIASKPQSIRLSKPDIAYYLLMLQETRGLSSISEAVRYCVHLAMRVEPIDAADLGLPVPTEEEAPEAEAADEIEIKVSGKDLVMKQIEEAQAEKEKEAADEFVF